ncbi:putative fatty acyl-CoA reductase CG5065 isoform X2 [Calliopsis andreniformis]
MTPVASSVAEWYRGRNVFITGGTGFMGKVLIYKLLLSCESLGNIFILVRQKKNVDPQARLQLLVQEEPFRVIREKYPERLKKLILIPGDTTVNDLALSTADKQRLQRDVSVVFHMAANVKFDLPLKEAVRVNTVGTLSVLNLAKQLPHLESFIHVSTTYCHCDETVLEERHYPCDVQPEVIINTVTNMNDEVLNAMTPKLIQGQPNTYAFTKALTEDLVQRCGLPVGIARPSIVVASWKEPVPGWVDNMNGPTGLMIGAGKGVLRTMLCNDNCLVNVIPCDMAINALIVLARKIGLEKPEKPIFMNLTNGDENPISWRYAVETGKKYAITYPYTGLLWYPGGSATTLRFYHWLRVILFHLIPAYFLDALIVLTGNKPFLVRVQHRINAGIALIEYYTTKQWIFRNDRMKELHEELNPSDKKKFFMDTAEISWDEYMLRYILGSRQYCLKDDPSTLPRARQVLRYLYFADWFVKVGLTVLFIWFVYSWINPSKGVTATEFDIHAI